MSNWETLVWTVARAGGLTAYVLLTLSVLMGLALSVRWQTARWPRLITNDLHRFVTLLSLVFIAVHGLAVWLDPFMRFGWSEIFVPLVSHYRPLWMALGIVAGYLGAALWVSTLLRPVIGYAWWRRLHGLAFAVYSLATMHGLATGSDTRTIWGLALYGGSVALVAALTCYRLLTPIGARARTYPNLAGLVAALVLGGVVWTASGPARAGWNATANNGQGSGARVAQPAAQVSVAPSFTAPFTAAIQGTLTQRADPTTGEVRVQVDATLSGGARGALHLLLRGVTAEDGSTTVTASQLSLAGPGGTPSYQGQLTQLQGDSTGWALGAVLATGGTPALTVQGSFAITPDGRVSGTLQGQPAARDAGT